MPRVAVGVALPYADGIGTPRVAVGVEWPTPRASLRRGLARRAGLARLYADGPDFWPSAYRKAVGASRHSCSVCSFNY